jgi:nucleoside 2-deoxyribosyltransferase
MRIYLSHPFDSRKKIRKWELEIKKKIPYLEIVNPFFTIKTEQLWRSYDKSNETYYKRLDYKSLIPDDLKLIEESDILLAIVDGKKSYGTIMEIVYAKLYKKNVMIICTNKSEKHPWLSYHADKIFTTFEEAEQWLKTL